MKKLFEYLVLPAEVTDFERQYLHRMNRIGFWFFAVHPLVFVLVAALCDTGPLMALGFGLALLAGPLMAWKTFDEPRNVSLVYGFTAMCMGGLLVHFGQGPMQIEMHFYFFVLLALLAVYANPTVILVAAVTVATHHLLLWWLIPSSIFNYDASIWTVVVHALFVVLESVAACFVARSFFDDVIGLEKIVSARTSALNERTEAMRLVLDNVAQGLLTLDREGRPSKERSRRVEEWLGELPPGATWGGVLGRIAPGHEANFEVNFEILLDDFMPREVSAENLAARIEVGDRILDLSYQVLTDGQDEISGTLVVITDVTEAVARARAEREQKETMEVFQRILRDKKGFVEFYEETDRIVRAVASGRDSEEAVKRMLHTIKGNAALFGATSIASCAHQLEDMLAESAGEFSEAGVERLVQQWGAFKSKLGAFLDDESMQRIEVEVEELDQALRLGMQNRPGSELATMMLGWKMEPTRARLNRLAEQARALGARYQRSLDVEVDDGQLRIEPKRWGPFWAALVHALRNAIDHGIEAPEERRALGKSPIGRLVLRTRSEADSILVEVEDDGRGVDWDRVRDKAKKLGMPCESEADLIGALMSSGLSTKEVVSDLSGRGVGMDALARATRALDGTIEVVSQPGKGTLLRMRVPQDRIYGTSDLRLAGTTGFELPVVA
jgi:two-component system, chemotaxis family, sensor kinase CheA